MSEELCFHCGVSESEEELSGGLCVDCEIELYGDEFIVKQESQ